METKTVRGNRLTKKPLWLHKRNWVAENEGVVVTTPSGKMFWLNESGGFIWKMCDGKHTIREIAEAMAITYDGLDRNTAVSDIFEFIQPLQRLGLVGLI